MIKLTLGLITIAIIDRLGISQSLLIPLVLILQTTKNYHLNFIFFTSMGLFFDLIMGQTLGLTAVLFLLFSLQIYFYYLRYDTFKITSVSLLSLVATIETHLVLNQQLSFTSVLFFVLVATIFWLMLSKVSNPSNSTEIYLKP